MASRTMGRYWTSADCRCTVCLHQGVRRQAAVVRHRCAYADRNLSDVEFGRLQKYCWEDRPMRLTECQERRARFRAFP